MCVEYGHSFPVLGQHLFRNALMCQAPGWALGFHRQQGTVIALKSSHRSPVVTEAQQTTLLCEAVS